MAARVTLTLRQVMALALDEALGTEAVIQLNDTLSEAFARELRRHGLALHYVANCARLPQQELGREMTAEERAAFGLADDA